MMLMQRLISRRKIPRYICVITQIKGSSYSTKHEIDPKVVEVPELRLSEPKKLMKQREPFVKNFFRAVYDVEFAAFPEPQTHERHGEFFEWLKPIEQFVESSIDNVAIDQTREIPPEIIEQLKCLGVFRAAVPDEYTGLGLNHSEYAKLIETLSRIPCLGVYFAKLAIPIGLISTYASEEQKTNYLPQIASGKCSPAVCISEDSEGSEGSAILSHARRSDCDNFWILNATKTFVINADNSDLFIVFAECSEVGRSFEPEDTISAFLVERSFSGITIGPPVKTLGLHGLTLCEINFKDTMVPVENIMGEVGVAARLFTTMYSEGKENMGAQAIGITRQYLKLLVSHLKNNKDFNAVQLKNDTIQECVGKIVCSIYGMESILYLTTGMMDTVVNQDCDLEKCIVESFCIDTCIEILMMGSRILGFSSQLEGSRFEQLIRDTISLISIDGIKSDVYAMVAMMGIQHLGNNISTKVRKARNPWADPLLTLKRIFLSPNYHNLYIADNLHPTMKMTAGLLECDINRLRNAVEEIIMRHGRSVNDRHMDLKRISDAASYLYVMAAVVARASRSYCLGMRDSEKEMKIAQVFGYAMHEKVDVLVKELNDGDHMNGDMLLLEIADGAFEKDAYYVEHPLARNF